MGGALGSVELPGVPGALFFPFVPASPPPPTPLWSEELVEPIDEPAEPVPPDVEGDAEEPLDVEPVPGAPLVPPLVEPPVCANAAPAVIIEITANRFHHVCIRNCSR